MNMTLPIFRSLWILSIHRNRQFVISSKFLYIFLIYRYNSSTSFNNQERLKMITFISDALFVLYIFGECKIVCVNRYCMNLLYAPYWGKQR